MTFVNCMKHVLSLLVSYLKSVQALKMKLIAPMPEQITQNIGAQKLAKSLSVF